MRDKNTTQSTTEKKPETHTPCQSPTEKKTYDQHDIVNLPPKHTNNPHYDT